MAGPERQSLDAVLAAYAITDPEQRAAVALAYQVATEYTAPFIVEVVDAMLDDLYEKVHADPACRIMFVGRDGHSLALATANLAPDLFAVHCSEAIISRSAADMAIQDLERNSGRSFPELAGFRGTAWWINPDHVNGARRYLADYLQRNGIPVGVPGSSVVVVDTSFKGTVQELLAAAFPQTAFSGCYVFFGQAQSDPHPGTKRGYAAHRGEASNGQPLQSLPDDPALTFSYIGAIEVVEYTLNGPLESPLRIGPDGPVQQRYQGE
jgi:hypothetical protein